MQPQDKYQKRALQKQIEILRKMTPEQRDMIACRLSAEVHERFRMGLRKLHPDLSEDELHKLYLKYMEKCYNMNW